MQRVPAEEQRDLSIAAQLAALPRVVVGEEREALVRDILEQHSTSRWLVIDAGGDHHGGRLGEQSTFFCDECVGQPGVEQDERIGWRVRLQQVFTLVLGALAVQILHESQSRALSELSESS